MRVLLDSCVWPGARVALEAAGHGVVHVLSWASDPGDAEILAIARREGRVIVTFDKDFGELVVRDTARNVGIVRLVSIPPRDQGPRVAAILEAHGAELARGALITAERDRTRLRAPPETDAPDEVPE